MNAFQQADAALSAYNWCKMDARPNPVVSDLADALKRLQTDSMELFGTLAIIFMDEEIGHRAMEIAQSVADERINQKGEHHDR